MSAARAIIQDKPLSCIKPIIQDKLFAPIVAPNYLRFSGVLESRNDRLIDVFPGYVDYVVLVKIA